jgi:hypothetical protein
MSILSGENGWKRQAKQKNYKPGLAVNIVSLFISANTHVG